MQKVIDNWDKIAKVLKSCKTDEQLRSTQAWIDNLVDKDAFYDRIAHSVFTIYLGATLLHRNDLSPMMLLK